MATVVIGAVAATGHFVGGMIGWWHAYEITFGSHKTEQARHPDKAPGLRADVQSLVANCHFMRAEYSNAAESARTAWQANPRLPAPPLTLAAALHRDGKVDEARKIVADYRFRNPDFQTAQLERLLAGTEPRFVEGRQRLIDSLRELGMQ